MATLTVRGIDDDVKAALRIRAAENGRSMEAEVRAILAEAVADERPRGGLGSRVAARFTGLGGVDLAFESRENEPRAADL